MGSKYNTKDIFESKGLSSIEDEEDEEDEEEIEGELDIELF